MLLKTILWRIIFVGAKANIRLVLLNRWYTVWLFYIIETGEFSMPVHPKENVFTNVSITDNYIFTKTFAKLLHITTNYYWIFPFLFK